MKMHGGRQSNHRAAVLALALALGLLQSAAVLADEKDKFEVSLGGYSVFVYDSTISLTEANLGTGIALSPRDTLGLDGQQTVFRLDSQYRFNRRHALTVNWYNISSDAVKILADDIDWVDENGDTITIPSGSSVASSLKYDIFKVGYLWSFYRSDKVELAAGAGLHLAKVKVALDVDSVIARSGLRAAKSDLPMPVVTFALDYSVTPNFDWFLKTQLFSLQLGDWRGTYADIQAGVKYRLSEHFGVGAGIGSNALEVVRESDDTRFEFDNRVTGLHLFVTAHF